MDYKMDNEQWKSDGDCTKCKRLKYCSQACTANMKATEKLILDSATEFFAVKLVKSVSNND